MIEFVQPLPDTVSAGDVDRFRADPISHPLPLGERGDFIPTASGRFYPGLYGRTVIEGVVSPSGEEICISLQKPSIFARITQRLRGQEPSFLLSEQLVPRPVEPTSVNDSVVNW